MPDAAVRDLRPRTPFEVDSFRPSAARMYDYYLGGTNHLAADREAADALLDAVPQVADLAAQNRAFLRRVVEFAVSQGVTQFLDLGSGFASAGGVADVALAGDPASRVVAVDIDPGVASQVATAVRTSGLAGRVGALHADLRDLVGVLEHPVTRRLLDFDRPIAILCLAVLHFVPGDLDRVLGPLRRTAAPGSLLALSHATLAPAPAEHAPRRRGGPDPAAIVRLVYDCTLTPLTLRSEDQLRASLTECELVEPGIVPLHEWRPTAGAQAPGSGVGLLGAVARLR